MEKISSYILTKNSEKYLSVILDKLALVSDEILIIDSGSLDDTEKIARSYKAVKFYYNNFVSFKSQRIFAELLCSNDIILFLDSDEIPDSDFIDSILEIKNNGFKCDAYTVRRKWNVLGKDVHSIYPIISPDNPIRMYRKNKTSFNNSTFIHETPEGFETLGRIEGSIKHITFVTRAEMQSKALLYSEIAAYDLLERRKKIHLYKLVLNPFAAFIKWYFLKQGYKDGVIGLHIGIYAYIYTKKKYKSAIQLIELSQI